MQADIILGQGPLSSAFNIFIHLIGRGGGNADAWVKVPTVEKPRIYKGSSFWS